MRTSRLEQVSDAIERLGVEVFHLRRMHRCGGWALQEMPFLLIQTVFDWELYFLLLILLLLPLTYGIASMASKHSSMAIYVAIGLPVGLIVNEPLLRTSDAQY